MVSSEAILAPALIISIAGNLYLIGKNRELLSNEDIRWAKLGRLQSIAMLYLAETYPNYNMKEESVMFTKTPKKVSVKAPWSNRSKILCGAFIAGVAGSVGIVVRDLKQAADDALIPETAVDAMLSDDPAALAAAAADGVTVTQF